VQPSLELPQLDDADFLIPAHRYKAAASKGWRVDDRCAVLWVEDGIEGVKVAPLYKLNPVVMTQSLKPPAFNPLNL
jgi:hypothetical protein